MTSASSPISAPTPPPVSVTTGLAPQHCAPVVIERQTSRIPAALSFPAPCPDALRTPLHVPVTWSELLLPNVHVARLAVMPISEPRPPDTEKRSAPLKSA